MDFTNKTVLLGIGGGIAAYKACDLIRDLQRHGVQRVHPLLTSTASQFVSPLTLTGLAKTPALQDPLAVDGNGVPLHISLAQQADAMLIVPATASLMGRLWAGLADDLVSTTALTMTGKPLILAPAMNTRMWDHPATQRNLKELAQWPNVTIVNPSAGLLACGETGVGHLADAPSLLRALYRALHPMAGRLAGQTVLVTAGGTREPLDPVRELCNRSSGKMGLALADELDAMGATVHLVTAQREPLLRSYTVIPVQTVAQLQAAVMAIAPQCQAIFKAAAVSDFTPAKVSASKVKKPPHDQQYQLDLVKTPDILAQLGQQKPPGQTLVGFAAETDHWLAHAQAKLVRKHLDWIVLNDVGRDDIGFGTTDNEVTIMGADGSLQVVDKAPKWQIARTLIEKTLGLGPSLGQAEGSSSQVKPLAGDTTLPSHQTD
jgi:phosphopantothenoylcysteine decarboxylase / phosphopantothenate---cysteine ligase